MLGRKQTDTELVVRYLAVNVRRLRLHLGLSVAQLAKRTFMDECQLGRIERTSKSITVATAVRLADGLGVPVATLFEGLEFDAFNATHSDSEWYGLV